MTSKEILKKEIGKRIEQIRENIMHMNKVQFASLIGMKNQYLSYVEFGEKGLTVEKVVEICNKTGVSADYLLRGIKNPLVNFTEDFYSKYSSKEINKSFEVLKDLFGLFK